MILPLSRYKEPVWKQKFKNIKKITPEIKKLVSDMKETLDLTGGVGLAAPQVGVPARLFVINFGKFKEAFINPKLISRKKVADAQEEGCLSVPRTWGIVSRPTKVEVQYQDLKGRSKKASLSGYIARIFQHEYDHLSSIFFPNRITDKRKIITYEPIKIVFFGTQDMGAIILQSLIGKMIVSEYKVSLVVTTPDQLSGRGKKLTSSPVRHLADQFKIEVSTPTSLKNNKEFIKKLKSIEPDFFVTISYGKILPKDILDIPKKAPLNIHFSLLPKHRGPSPIQNTILKGDLYAGVTIFHMNEKIDAGDILASAKIRIKKNDTAQTLTERLTNLSSDLVNYLLHTMTIGKVKPKPQVVKGATYTHFLKKEDGYVDLKKPPTPSRLDRMVRAYYPWPGVWTNYNGKILKILPDKKVQIEGKKPVPLKQFKQGHKDFKLNW